MIILSQQNPTWGDARIGNSGITLARYGCTITGISMLSDYFGKWVAPDFIASKDWFTKDGLIIWSKINLSKMAFEKRLYGRNDAEILESVNHPDKAVLLQVQNYHWVVCLGKIPFTNQYRIADPWFGDKSTTLRYKGFITGSAHFVRKP